MFDKIIAHRGIHNDKVPENSLKAFDLAVSKNVPIELDVHILKDGKVVVFHDDKLKRMTSCDKRIKDCTYDEIRNLKLNDSIEKIPTLKDVLKLVNGRVPIVIEFKCDVLDHSLEKEVIKIIDNYKGELLLKSFNYKIVKYLKKNTNREVGFLYSSVENKKKKYGFLKRFIYKHIDFRLFIKPDFISCDYHMINNNNIKKYRKTGKKLFIWTIRTKEDYEKYKDKCDKLIVENII